MKLLGSLRRQFMGRELVGNWRPLPCQHFSPRVASEAGLRLGIQMVISNTNGTLRPMNFSAVILAGGKSSRMGRDKALLKIDGEALLDRQIHTARKAGATEVFISSGAIIVYEGHGCEILTDRFPGAGPLAGIESALHHANENLLLVLAVDMPCVNTNLICAMASATSFNNGVVAHDDRNFHPLVAFYPKIAGFLASAQLKCQRNRVREFALNCANNGLIHRFRLGMGACDLLANWNRPDDCVVGRRLALIRSENQNGFVR